MKAKPPVKKLGVPIGTRNVGHPGSFVMDVHAVALWLDETEDAVRAQTSRGLLPHLRISAIVITQVGRS